MPSAPPRRNSARAPSPRRGARITTGPPARQDRHAVPRALRLDRHGWRAGAGAHRAARRAEPTYAALCDTIRGSPVVTPDETGWKVAARLHWLWAYATPDTTVYAIQPGRGFEEAAAMLGDAFAGVLVRDGGPRIAASISDASNVSRPSVAPLPHAHSRSSRAPLCATRPAGAAARAARPRPLSRDRISPHGLAVARGHLVNQLNALIDRPGRSASRRSLPPISPSNSPPCLPSCSTPTPSTRPTGAPNTPCDRRSSRAKSVAAIAVRVARIPKKSSPASSAPSSNATVDAAPILRPSPLTHPLTALAPSLTSSRITR